MKRHFFSSILFILSALIGVTHSAQAALITTNFSELTDNTGTLDIQFTLAAGETVEGFSLYFSETLFSDISIVSSPDNWDSLIFQPDALLGAGLFDNFNVAGLISGSARIAFTFLGSSALPTLNYDLYNADFQITESGTATPVSASVTEPSSLLLILCGLFAVALQRQSRATRNCFHQPAASH